MAEEETEYESDPEEAKMSLKMRRREASDDEDGEPRSRSVAVDSEGESDGQGAAAEYDDDDDDEEEEEEDEEDFDKQEEYEEEDEHKREEEREIVGEMAVEEIEGGREIIEQQGEGEEEKKENEPFAVPTSGAFYMHDDRFRDIAGGRHRRTFGGRRLWESKDDRKWGHDKFEEMNMPDRHYAEGRRSSKGYHRGRGKARGVDRGYARGSRMRGYGGNNYQNAAPKDVRGRGPRKYQPSMRNKNETLSRQNKQFAKSHDKSSHAGSSRVDASTANPKLVHESFPAKKVASNLSSASPPFYPSGSSNKDIALTQKKEVQGVNHSRNVRPSAVDHNFSMPQSTTFLQGKNVVDSIGMENLLIDDSVSPASAQLNNVHLPSSSMIAAQMTQSRAKGRGLAPSGPAIFQPSQTNSQVKKGPPPAAQASQRIPVQSQGQPTLKASGQLLDQHPHGGSQSCSPPKSGKGTVHGTGRGSLAYGGAQVMGSGGGIGTGHGDPNLPAFFPVMQFGGQRPGGIGVPAVGMAFPGYVAQPNGVGNSEMTWLPVLASAAGALGAPYCSPYIAVDGTYQPQPTGQASALPAPSKENNISRSNNELKPQQRSEVANDEYSQRQNKPRRYSEMNFSQ